MHTHGRRLYIIPLFATLSACTESVRPAETLSLASSAAALEEPALDPNFDRFSVFTEVTLTGGGPANKAELPKRGLAYETVRVLEGDSSWTTTVTYVDKRLLGEKRFGLAKRVVKNDTLVEYHDLRGRVMTSADFANRLKAAGLGKPPAARPEKRARGNPRSWMSNFVLGPESKRAVRAALERTHGAPSKHARGLRFAKTRGNRTYESILDPSTDLIVEEAVIENGKDMWRTKASYREVKPGLHVRTGTTLEFAAANNQHAMVVEQTFSNPRFERVGGR